MERSLDSYSSIKDVTYSCGYCGYALNLSSSARDTAGIGSKYSKQIKKGVIAFVSVDESRFTLADEVTCKPYFRSRRAWGLFRKRSRLLCRKCGGRIGNAYDEEDGRDPCLSDGDGDDDGFSDDLRASSGSVAAAAPRRARGATRSRSARCSRRQTILLMFPPHYDEDGVGLLQCACLSAWLNSDLVQFGM